MRPCRATRAGTQAPPLLISVIHLRTIPYKQSNHLHAILSNETNRPHAIHPNETVGAAPVCAPKRSRNGVSIPKIHTLCAGNLTIDAPLWGDTGGHIGTAPTHLHHIFPHIPHKQNNHLHTIRPNETNSPRAIHPNGINRPCTILSSETVGAVPMCPPERPRSGVSIRK
ncbi:hypothetical protein HMPREF9431_01002 [Segatella oulorum F0390]|uniref:Uncharacterized protein n=1 Tax=Segatella oulorum F0390 TaxID=702438 RepID=G1WB01_9BACT|nr:hypothetical protein HMPREF9431_01002 [Segatella oulorum F0390]